MHAALGTLARRPAAGNISLHGQAPLTSIGWQRRASRWRRQLLRPSQLSLHRLHADGIRSDNNGSSAGRRPDPMLGSIRIHVQSCRLRKQGETTLGCRPTSRNIM